MADKVLILGAKGMLGSALSNGFRNSIKYLWDLDELDIGNSAQVNEKISKLKPDIIINAAAYTKVDNCEDDYCFKMACRVNTEGVGNLVSVANKLNIPLAHFSTDYVFNGILKNVYLETDAPQGPVNRYGLTKLGGENKLKGCKKHYLIRTSGLFGGNGINFVDMILEKAKNGLEVEVVDDQVTKPTYTIDLATMTEKLILQKLPYGVYHVVNEGSCSWFAFAKAILELSGRDVPLKAIKSIDLKNRALRPLYAILQNTKLPPLRLFQDALKDYLKTKALI